MPNAAVDQWHMRGRPSEAGPSAIQRTCLNPSAPRKEVDGRPLDLGRVVRMLGGWVHVSAHFPTAVVAWRMSTEEIAAGASCTEDALRCP